MSVFGQTQYQPRVFAHDAIALSDLCGIPAAIASLAAAPPPVADQGTGYTAGPTTYQTTTNGGGFGATVSVTAVGGSGEVTNYTLVNSGTNYQVGDILTLVGGGSDNNCRIEIATVTACSTWDPWMPIVPYPPRNRRGIPPAADGLSPAWDRQPFKYNDGTDIYQASEGSAIYVGIALTSLTVIQKGAADPNTGNDPGLPTATTTYHGVPAGTFMPIDILTVTEIEAEDAATYPDPYPYVLALF